MTQAGPYLHLRILSQVGKLFSHTCSKFKLPLDSLENRKIIKLTSDSINSTDRNKNYWNEKAVI